MSGNDSKTIAGYHMLMVLSAVDGKINGRPNPIIEEYIHENESWKDKLAEENSIWHKIPTEDYAIHFNDAMNRFYMHTTQDERNHFLDLATRLVASDSFISPRENLFLNELYNAWEEEIED